MRRVLSPEEEKKIRECLIQQATSGGLTDRQIAQKCRCSVRTLIRRRRQLEDELKDEFGISSDSDVERDLEARHRHIGKRISQYLLRAQKLGGDDGPGPSLLTLLDAYPEIQILTDQNKERLLSILAHKSTPTVAVQAIRALDELHRYRKPPNEHRLKPPLTEEEAVERLAMLLDVSGREIATAAIERARELSSELNSLPTL
jgi:hypothetical protein